MSGRLFFFLQCVLGLLIRQSAGAQETCAMEFVCESRSLKELLGRSYRGSSDGDGSKKMR